MILNLIFFTTGKKSHTTINKISNNFSSLFFLEFLESKNYWKLFRFYHQQETKCKTFALNALFFQLLSLIFFLAFILIRKLWKTEFFSQLATVITARVIDSNDSERLFFCNSKVTQLDGLSTTNGKHGETRERKWIGRERNEKGDWWRHELREIQRRVTFFRDNY